MLLCCSLEGGFRGPSLINLSALAGSTKSTYRQSTVNLFIQYVIHWSAKLAHTHSSKKIKTLNTLLDRNMIYIDK